MIFISKFLTNLTRQKLERMIDEADDVFELPGDFKALRLNNKIVVVDDKKYKVVKELRDTFPSTPARAAYEIGKELELFENKKSTSKDVWTCNFRENRWVWYQNAQPKMTVTYNDLKKNQEIDYENFSSAKFGTGIIKQISENNIDFVSNKINGLILVNSYISLDCKECSKKDKYTIDDLVTQERKANYDGNYIICSNCGNLIELK